ncbi:sodium:proton antiporter [Kosmotoga pacifica]|uniref:NADH-ubiquinone oxidoreductase subunit 4L n=1 Tax=Kosmotoga pacifica TaxID=1330330 RepID=A0A0G2Z599_9BACT|nr:sodium:proton antiporter [Kosmotoga pacifica]AKI96795.1 NADH-ubiquinone oxidoreductase subunit 4L [Kosmotoga pacifica]
MISEAAVYASLIGVFLGTLGMLLTPNMIKKILALGIVETSVTLFYTAISSMSGTRAPIISSLPMEELQFADPIPQAVIITSIVIGFTILSLLLVFTIMLHNRYHTVDVILIEKILEGEEE